MYHKKTQHIDFTEGYILHKKPFEEHKLLLSIFDKSHGIIRGIARRPSAKKTSCIEPFTPLALQVKTSSGLASIQRIEPVTHHFIPPLMGAHLWAGLYCNELLYRLCHPQETYPKTFLQYEKTLQALSQRSPIRKAVRLFEYHLLQEIGFSIDFSCLDNEASWYHYCSDNGLTPCPESYPKKFSRNCVENLHDEKYENEETLKLMKHIFHISINRLLGPAAIEVASMLT